MSERKAVVCRTEDGRYVFAIAGATGFIAYRIFRATPYYRRMIRRLARKHKAQIASRILWDRLPLGDFIEKPDGQDAQVVAR